MTRIARMMSIVLSALALCSLHAGPATAATNYPSVMLHTINTPAEVAEATSTREMTVLTTGSYGPAPKGQVASAFRLFFRTLSADGTGFFSVYSAAYLMTGKAAAKSAYGDVAQATDSDGLPWQTMSAPALTKQHPLKVTRAVYLFYSKSGKGDYIRASAGAKVIFQKGRYMGYITAQFKGSALAYADSGYAVKELAAAMVKRMTK